MRVNLCVLACAAVELAEAEVAVGDEGTHAEVGGDRQSLLVVRFRLAESRQVALGGELTEEPQQPSLVHPVAGRVEAVGPQLATFGLLAVIWGCARGRPRAVP